VSNILNKAAMSGAAALRAGAAMTGFGGVTVGAAVATSAPSNIANMKRFPL
jgi:hypothetical protein